jgi:hypothetical protein
MAFLKNQLDFETFHGKNRKEYQNGNNKFNIRCG